MQQTITDAEERNRQRAHPAPFPARPRARAGLLDAPDAPGTYTSTTPPPATRRWVASTGGALPVVGVSGMAALGWELSTLAGKQEHASRNALTPIALLVLLTLWVSCATPALSETRMAQVAHPTAITWQVEGPEVQGSGGMTHATLDASGTVISLHLDLDPAKRRRGLASTPVGQPVKPGDVVRISVKVADDMAGTLLRSGLYQGDPTAEATPDELMDVSGLVRVEKAGVLDLHVRVRNVGETATPWITLGVLAGSRTVTAALEVVELAVRSPAPAGAWGGWRTRARVALASLALGFCARLLYEWCIGSACFLVSGKSPDTA